MLIATRIAELAVWLPKNKFLASSLIATALAAGALLVRNVGGPASGRRRRTTMIVMMLLAGLILALGGSLFLIENQRWGYLLALLPGATIARHAVYMRLVRRRSLAAPVSAPPGLRQSPIEGSTGRLEQRVPELSQVFRRARQLQELDFAPDTLAVRFGIPALLTTFIGIGVFEFLWRASRSLVDPKTNDPLSPLLLNGKMVTAAWFGAAG